MANTTIDAPRGFSWRSMATPFAAIGRFLVLIAEAVPHAREIERLNQLSDAQLAARGLTREGEIRRIMGVSAAL
ncbi:hypothetical protein RAH32_00370 [Paracoccus sp. WLY502]|uniref:hypothetical protein n=1 Tax=Paracoccus yibinensis TaxID=3068891 RepID=UPI002796CBF8|nr:hypothetical protein [Paracoccus sp. WLY502]MDQ1898900.1 hypothetical protein [Paracoccus sp. WLY502]